MSFAEILQELREDNDITRKDLATILNISVSTLGMYEQGRREPNIDMLIKIADYFNVPLDFLVGRKNFLNTEHVGTEILAEALAFKRKFDKLPPNEKNIVRYILNLHK